MTVSIRDEIANTAIQNVFQEYVDEMISLDEVMDRLWDMYHPIVAKKPSECSQRELVIVSRWHHENAEIKIRAAQELVRSFDA